VLIRRSQAGDWGDDYDRGYRNTLNEIIQEASAHGDVPFAGLGKEKPSDVRGSSAPVDESSGSPSGRHTLAVVNLITVARTALRLL
jgi:hypothetical protein